MTITIAGTSVSGSYSCPCCLGTFDLLKWDYIHHGDPTCALADNIYYYTEVETKLAEAKMALQEADLSRYYTTPVELD